MRDTCLDTAEIEMALGNDAPPAPAAGVTLGVDLPADAFRRRPVPQKKE